jgi:predicted RNase H-like HicB family nuclease
MSYKVSVIIEKDESGYYAYSPELEGCQTQGDSFEEVMSNIREAIELYLETLPQKERKQYLSQELYTTSIEVNVA